MSNRFTIVAPVALTLLGGAAWAQTEPQLIGISVEGTVVEVPVDLAAQACGISAETLLEQWEQLDTQMSTMADTTVAADATDLAPVASPDDTQKASGVGGEETQPSGVEGTAAAEDADAANAAADGAKDTDATAAADPSAADGDLAPVVAAASPAASAAANPQDALDESATATEGTGLSKAAVCEIDARKAAELGIDVPG